MPDSRRRRITLLTPVFNEQENLPTYMDTVGRVLLSRTDVEYSVLFIDDGSRDRSWAVIQEICAANVRFRGLRLSRNFGAHIAITAGLDAADGDAVVVLACDLQDPAETVIAFAQKWQGGADIVWGHRRQREDTWWRQLASRGFAWMLRRYAMPPGSRFTTGSFLLADRKVAEGVRQMREQSRITFALVAWTGFRQDIVEYDRKQRRAGVSGWNFRRMIRTMYDAFVGFSALPIRLTTTLGVLISILNIPLGVYILAGWLVGDPVPGYTSLMLLLIFFFGIQFLLMGLVGEYLYRIYLEAVGRPLYFLADQCGAFTEENRGSRRTS